MLCQKTDEEIIELYQGGVDEIFKELIEKYTPLIFNFIAHIIGRKETPDIVQEVFIKVWKNLKKFDPKKASFKTWIFTIAKNSAIDYLKKRKNILFSDLENEENPNFSENIQDEELLPDQSIQRLEDSHLLNKLLNELPLLNRTILILHYQEEMTFEEIGKILNKPQNTVKSYHHRAILELRKKLS